jgi:hypothetical protein
VVPAAATAPLFHRRFGRPDIMGVNQSALLRLGREKRGKAQLEDLSSNLVIQLGAVTEELKSAPVRDQYSAHH